MSAVCLKRGRLKPMVLNLKLGTPKNNFTYQT